jgi:hypothetical protein
MDGSAEFVITIDNEARVEIGNTGPGGATPPRTISKPETGSPEKTAPNPTEDKEKDKDRSKPGKTEKDSESPTVPGN